MRDKIKLIKRCPVLTSSNVGCGGGKRDVGYGGGKCDEGHRD